MLYHLVIPVFVPYSADSLEAKADSQSFLFTLVNPSGIEPTKITPKPGASGGIRCQRDLGPAFGSNAYYDLQIWNVESAGRLGLGFSFKCPQNANKSTYFTGQNPFEINEVEVFKVHI